MGLMRALTLKRVSNIHPTRSLSTLKKGRPQISLPTELLSTTNVLSYTAPSVESMQQAAVDSAVASSASSTTIHEYAASEGAYTTPETPSTPTTVTVSRRSSRISMGSEPSLTDASSVSSHSSANSPQLNDSLDANNSYFTMDTLTKPSSNNSARILSEDSIDPLSSPTPALPRRAPSHSKREHERLARRRSQRTSLRPVSATASLLLTPAVTATAADEVLSPALSSIMPELAEVDEEPVLQVSVLHVQQQEDKQQTSQMIEQYPFSQELKQLSQVVEQLSILAEDEDMRIMRERNLRRWSVSGYLDIVEDVWGNDYAMSSQVAVSA